MTNRTPLLPPPLPSPHNPTPRAQVDISRAPYAYTSVLDVSALPLGPSDVTLAPGGRLYLVRGDRERRNPWGAAATAAFASPTRPLVSSSGGKRLTAVAGRSAVPAEA